MPPLPERITPTLAAIHAGRIASRRQGNRGSTFIGAGEAGSHECARAIWMGFRWVSPAEAISPRQARLFETGNIEEKRILDDLRQVEGVELYTHDEDGKQYRREIAGYIVAKTDGVVIGLPEAPKAWHVISCKSANDKNFRAVKTKGVAKAKFEHWLQCQIEMAALGIQRALYFLVNKNDDEEYIERIKSDSATTERSIARLVGVAEAPRPPGRIREDAIKPPCLWCRHKTVCHEGAQARMNCRTCISSTPRPGGNWWCEFWSKELTPEEQGVGCSAHLYIPDLVAGEQIDASVENRTVTYRMADGREWTDGAKEVAV